MSSHKQRPRSKPKFFLDGYWSADEVVAQLGIHPETLKRWHRVGNGPPFTRVGRCRFYAHASVAAWLKSRERLSSLSA